MRGLTAIMDNLLVKYWATIAAYLTMYVFFLEIYFSDKFTLKNLFFHPQKIFLTNSH